MPREHTKPNNPTNIAIVFSIIIACNRFYRRCGRAMWRKEPTIHSERICGWNEIAAHSNRSANWQVNKYVAIQCCLASDAIQTWRKKSCSWTPESRVLWTVFASGTTGWAVQITVEMKKITKIMRMQWAEKRPFKRCVAAPWTCWEGEFAEMCRHVR